MELPYFMMILWHVIIEVIRVCDHKEIRDKFHQITWKAKVRKFISSNLIWGLVFLSSLCNRVIVVQRKLLWHSGTMMPGLESGIANGWCEWIRILLPPYTKVGELSTSQTSGICLFLLSTIMWVWVLKGYHSKFGNFQIVTFVKWQVKVTKSKKMHSDGEIKSVAWGF